MKTLIAVFALTIAALGQSAPTCPVTITKTSSGLHGDSPYIPLTLEYTNTGYKKIVGVEFYWYVYNAVGHKQYITVLTGKTDAKPGEKKNIKTEYVGTHYDAIGQGAVTVKLRFEDGSTWEPAAGLADKTCAYDNMYK
jgi:hypothetical protein